MLSKCQKWVQMSYVVVIEGTDLEVHPVNRCECTFELNLLAPKWQLGVEILTLSCLTIMAAYRLNTHHPSAGISSSNSNLNCTNCQLNFSNCTIRFSGSSRIPIWLLL